MRKLILFFVSVLMFSFLTSSYLSAKVMDTRDIEFRAANDGEDVRSVLPVYGSIEGNTIRLSFLDISNTVTVSILDQAGGIVSTEVYQASRVLLIPVNQKAGEYKIQVSFGRKSFAGSFELK